MLDLLANIVGCN